MDLPTIRELFQLAAFAIGVGIATFIYHWVTGKKTLEEIREELASIRRRQGRIEQKLPATPTPYVNEGRTDHGIKVP